MAELFGLLNFNVDKRQNLLMSSVYGEIGNVSLLGAVVGTYEFGFSLTLNFDQANKSEFVRFSLDGGATWTEFQTDIGNSTTDTPLMYQFYKEGLSGDLSLQVEARKEDATGIMNIIFVDTWIRRVK